MYCNANLRNSWLNNHRQNFGTIFENYLTPRTKKNTTGVTAPVVFCAAGAFGKHSEIIERNINEVQELSRYLRITPTVVKEHNITCLNVECWSASLAHEFVLKVIPTQLHCQYKYKTHNTGILVIHKDDLVHFV